MHGLSVGSKDDMARTRSWHLQVHGQSKGHSREGNVRRAAIALISLPLNSANGMVPVTVKKTTNPKEYTSRDGLTHTSS